MTHRDALVRLVKYLEDNYERLAIPARPLWARWNVPEGHPTLVPLTAEEKRWESIVSGKLHESNKLKWLVQDLLTKADKYTMG